MTDMTPNEDLFFDALIRKDSAFEGIFIVGVKTTGIFCRPTCTARKPRRENVEFFTTPREALLRGYRPCKICHPLEPQGAVPNWLQPLLEEIDANPHLRLHDGDLRRRGVDPARLRRWFKEHHGMTFQAYLRALRIGLAFGRIKHGETVTTTAYQSGYESLSGFSESFKRTTGFSPGKSGDQSHPVMITRILTPLGPMLAGAAEEGICLLEFVDRRMLETQLVRLRRLLKAELIPGASPFFGSLDAQLAEYFSGSRKVFDLPLVLAGTPFQKQVWGGLQAIPYGETRSYQEQAQYIGNPAAVRAVARANGDNRLAILIPCHRVIGKNGELVGYGGGLLRKKFLLDLERDHR